VQLKDALNVHFADILNADSCVGGNHAAVLKQHIDGIVAGKESLMKPAPLPDIVTEWPAALPKAVARFAPRATFNPPANLGKLYVYLVCNLGPLLHARRNTSLSLVF
jgi:hypothetical protein